MSWLPIQTPFLPSLVSTFTTGAFSLLPGALVSVLYGSGKLFARKAAVSDATNLLASVSIGAVVKRLTYRLQEPSFMVLVYHLCFVRDRELFVHSGERSRGKCQPNAEYAACEDVIEEKPERCASDDESDKHAT